MEQMLAFNGFASTPTDDGALILVIEEFVNVACAVIKLALAIPIEADVTVAVTW